MSSVAERSISGLLASTPGYFPGKVDGDFYWRKGGGFVRTIAKWLITAEAALAPPVGARLYFHNHRFFLSNVWLVHFYVFMVKIRLGM